MAQEQGGVEKPIYYISKLMKGLELRYSTTEKVCLSLAFAVSKFNQYFLGHHIQLVTKSTPVKYLLTHPQLSGRMAQWAILTSCPNIECIRPSAIKRQAMADLLANIPGTSDFSLPQQEVLVTKEQEWSMHFDGSSTSSGGGIRSSAEVTWEKYTFTYKLCFPYSNNEAEYKALMTGLKVAKRLNIRKLKVFWDFKLVIKQVEGTHGVKNPNLVTYRAMVQELMKHFTSTECKVVYQNENRLAVSLATLATKSILKKEKMTLQVEK